MEAPVVMRRRNNLALTSLILGIVAIIPGCALWILGSLIGLAAIVTGAIALSQVNHDGTTGQGLAIAGIVIGAVAGLGDLLFGGIIPLMIFGPIIGNTFSTINSSLNTIP